jgi:L-threonylcarbamoyladenylate synthase
MITLSQYLQERGNTAIIPTDTVYGVVARAADPQAVERLYTLKQRDSKPGTLVAANIDQLVAIGIERQLLLGANVFWPGAVSIIITCGYNLEYLHQGIGSLAIRIPDDPWLLDLLHHTGPLLTSSANQPGLPPATTMAEAKNYFGDQVGWYQDGGVVNREPSTVIRIINSKVEVVRFGAVTFDASGKKQESS